MDCILVWVRSFQNSGCYGNLKVLLTYNVESGVQLFFWDIFNHIIFKLAGNQDKHKVSNRFEFQQDQTTHFRVMCPWVQIKNCSFQYNLVKLANNQDRHRVSAELTNSVMSCQQLVMLELFAPECRKKTKQHICNFPQSSCFTYM